MAIVAADSGIYGRRKKQKKRGPERWKRVGVFDEAGEERGRKNARLSALSLVAIKM